MRVLLINPEFPDTYWSFRMRCHSKVSDVHFHHLGY